MNEGFSFGPKPGFIQHHTSDAHVVIPDDHLLFSGSYVRLGNDLIISDAEHKLVVGNYFKGETRPTLTSVTGATLSAQIVDALTGHVNYAQAAAPAAAVVLIIGHVMKLSGSATVIRNGVSIELHIGDGVQKGDVIQTGSDSSVGLTCVDGTAFGMTSNARMVMNEMIYDPNGSSNSSLISLVQGTITFVAGQTAKNGNMRVETPVATMGIRGTAVLVEIAANDGPTKFSVLAEPDGHTGSFNLYDKVTGQLIGTVSQAGQVTFVSSLGIGQPPTAVEQLKTLQDQQNEKFIIQQVFQLFFPNYNPDNANPKGPKFGSSSTNNLAEIIIGTQTFGDNQVAIKQIELRFTSTDPLTGQPAPSGVMLYNTKAIFSATAVFAEQSFSPDQDSFKIADVVHITDPDVGTNPFNDIAIPFVPGSAVIVSATSTIPFLDAAYLTQFLHINQETGEVTFDRLDFNFLGKGESVTFILEVTATSGPDSARVRIPITIYGDNDLPNGAPTIVQGPETVVEGTVKEDRNFDSNNKLTSNNTITFQDVDLTDTHTASFVFVSSHSTSTLPGFAAGAQIGTFSLDPSVTEDTEDTNNTGTIAWHFSLSNDNPVLQSLAEGQTITQVYEITIKDNHGADVTQTVTITITGTNDTPVVLSSTTYGPAYVQEDTFWHSASGSITFKDVDLIDTHSASAQLTNAGGFAPGALGTFTFHANENPNDTSSIGSFGWTFTLNDALAQQLAEGQFVTQTYLVTISDGHGGTATQPITVTIGGTNDKPVIVSSTTNGPAYVQEDSVWQTASGSITFKDVDLIDTHSASVQLTSAGGFGPGALGTFTFHANENPNDASNIGSFGWTFTLDNALAQQLGDGEVVTQTYLVTISDGHGGTVTQPITVTIGGSNDKPVLHDVVAGSLTDTAANDTFSNLVGQLNGSDVDTHDTLSYFVLNTHGVPVHGPVSGQYGTLTVNADGSYTYVPNADAINALQAGQHKTDTFTIETKDSHGAFDTATLKVDVYGANDRPVLDASDVSKTDSYNNYGWTHTFTFQQLTGSDADGGSGVYTLKLTAHDGTLSLIDNHNGYNGNSDLSVSGAGSQSLTISGSLGDINAALTGRGDGFTYSTSSFETGVETVKAVLSNGSGPGDTVNFIFKQGGLGGAIMTGTADNDVFFGNSGQDRFDFTSSGFGHDTILNFNVQNDLIKIGSGQAVSLSALQHLGMTTSVGDDTLITPDAAGHPGDTILLKGVHLYPLSA